MPALKAGELDRRVTILRPLVQDDGLSRVGGAPTTIGQRWAKKTDVSDAERVAAAAQGMTLTSRFLMRFDSLTATIGSADRLLCEGIAYEVVGAKEAIGRRIAIEITAKALL